MNETKETTDKTTNQGSSIQTFLQGQLLNSGRNQNPLLDFLKSQNWENRGSGKSLGMTKESQSPRHTNSSAHVLISLSPNSRAFEICATNKGLIYPYLHRKEPDGSCSQKTWNQYPALNGLPYISKRLGTLHSLL